jgi:hypothetical protein
MKHWILSAYLLLTALSIQAQEGPILPTGYHIDFKRTGFSELKSVDELNERATEARVILSGENHMFSDFNALGEYRFLRYFYETAGVRHFVLELSPTRALYMERYFNNTDSTAARFLRATSSDDYMRLFDSIRMWNQTLADSVKIKVHGLDVERFYDMTIMHLGELIQRRKIAPLNIRLGAVLISDLAKQIEKEGLEEDYVEWVPSGEDIQGEVQEMVDTTMVQSDSVKSLYRNFPDERLDINAHPGDDYDDFESIVGDLYEWLSKNAAIDGKYADSSLAWKEWMGDDYLEYAAAFKQLREWYLFLNNDLTAQQGAWREEHMYQNMVKLLRQYPEAKFFGQFGRCHVSKSKQQQDCGWFEYSSLLTRLRTRYFKNEKSVLSIGIFYKERFFDSRDIFAVDLENNIAINQEVKAIMQTVDDAMILYFTKDSVASSDGRTGLVELAKKFDFVLAHDFLEGVDDASSEGNERNSVDLISRHVGLSIGARFMPTGLFSESLINHFADNAYVISDASLNTMPISLTFLNRYTHLEMGYTKIKSTVFSGENGERIQYKGNIYHMDAGLHSGDFFGRWQLGIGMRAFYWKHQFKYIPPTLNFGNPVVNGIQSIESKELIPAGYVMARYRPHNNLSFYSKVGYQQTQALVRSWQFAKTGLEYYNGQNLGGVDPGIFMELGVTLNLDQLD